MKTIFDHIEYAKTKPHHVKKRIVFGAAGAGTALIAFVWLAGSLSTDAFAIKGSSFADSGIQEPAVVVGSDTTGDIGSGVAGAAAALQGEDAPAHIEIVDTSTSTPTKQAEQTTIPF
jgi:hypothetical protein